ncbi:MAG: PCRF domain-containing protein, partial [Muribaculaceae bacterium]|nr:PCRF domain-containing protein [Muribaculaceae bacterium]
MAENSLLSRLSDIDARFQEVSTLIADPSVIADMKRYVKLSKEYKELEKLSKATARYRSLINSADEAREILDTEKDPDMREMAKEELDHANAELPKMEEEIKLLLIPADPDTGDILVFLPGERDIRECAETLGRERGATDEIIPLLASLPASEQQRAFRTSARRRIILATNVAETSVTIPGIRFVVDSGLARLSRYIHRTQVQRLQIEPVSQASARQRAGRCGRLGPGTCIRLYSEVDLLRRDPYTPPEILRSSLAGVILTMLDLTL